MNGCADTQTLQATGFDAARLCEVLRDFSDGKTNFHGLVIERHGAIVAEQYRRGPDKPIYSRFTWTTDFDASTLHDLRSISKSITSLLWGIAQGQNKTPPLGTPVLDLFPDLTDLRGQGRQSITLAHLFGMSSGLSWNEPNPNDSTNDEFGLWWRSSQARYLFNRPMASPAGTRFNYNGGSTAVLAQILTERVGMRLTDFARKVLFEPLGITDWEWKSDMRGRPIAYAGLRMRPHDLARIGRMMLQHGQWQGRQIVPSDWIDESTRAHIDVGDGIQYGYQWWTGKVDAMSATYDWSGGIGNGGQRLYMVPGLDLVVVMTAGDYNKPEIHRLCDQLFQRIAATVQEKSRAETVRLKQTRDKAYLRTSSRRGTRETLPASVMSSVIALAESENRSEQSAADEGIRKR